MASKGGRRPRRRPSMKLFSCIAPWRRSRKKAAKVICYFISLYGRLGSLLNVKIDDLYVLNRGW